jgi:hypothetical protein
MQPAWNFEGRLPELVSASARPLKVAYFRSYRYTPYAAEQGISLAKAKIFAG